MAQILIKRSFVSTEVPVISNLALGELYLNVADGKIFMKKNNGSTSIVEIGSQIFTGDATGSGNGAINLTLKTSGVAPGVYRTVTVNAKGIVTGGSNPSTIQDYGITDVAPLNSPSFTGQVTIPEGTALLPGLVFANDGAPDTGLYHISDGIFGTTNNTIPTTKFTSSGVHLFLIPTAPTATVSTNTTQLATTAYVNAQIINDAPSKIGSRASGTWGISITGNANTVTNLTYSQITGALGYVPANSGNAGSAGGYATLDATGKLLADQLPTSIVGAVVYQGVWNASTNTPVLLSSVGIKGQYYKISVTGSTAIDGYTLWNAGDMIIFNGSTWDVIDGPSSEVVSVSGKIGIVTLTQSDITGLQTTSTPTFAGLTAPTIIGTLTGNATTATTAANVLGGSVSATTGLFTGSVTAPRLIVGSGTALLPSLTFVADGALDTGLYWGGDGMMHFTNNGVYSGTIFSGGHMTLVGTVTASSFIGSGSSLTGTASGLSVGGSAATVNTILSSQITTSLGFNPVQQGTGLNQQANVIKLGWSTSSKLKVTVDVTDMGNIALESSVSVVNPSSTPKDGDVLVTGGIVSIFASGAWRQIFPAVYS